MGMVVMLQGSYRLRLHSDKEERMLNIFVFHGIQVLDVEKLHLEDVYDEGDYDKDAYDKDAYDKDAYDIEIFWKDYEAVTTLCDKYHVSVDVLQRKGLPAWIHYYKSRISFFVGALLCLTFLWIMSQCIWEIEFRGNIYHTEEELLKYFRKEKIFYGSRVHSFSGEEQELKLRKTYNDIAWCSICTEGCKLIVTITESHKFDSDQKIQSGYCLVASHEAVISSIITRSGTPLVKQGDEVQKGQPLVEGYIIYQDDYENETGIKQCVADADVMGRYEIPINLAIAFDQKINQTKQCQLSAGILHGSQSIQVRKPKMSDDGMQAVLTEYTQNNIIRRILPDTYWIKRCLITYETVNQTMTLKEAEIKMENEIEQHCKKIEENGIKIIEKNLHLEHNKKEIMVKGNITVEERFCTYMQSELPEIRKDNNEP